MSTFPNLDFFFRRGTKAGLNNTPIKNGSFNICKDTCEMYVDIDNMRIPIKSINRNYTEEEIINGSIQSYSEDIIYISTDTNAGYILSVASGLFVKIFDTIEYATLEQLSELSDKVNALAGFTQKIVNSVSDLPEIGESGIIYFVKKEKSEDSNLYDEYIWVIDSKTGEGRYELIGVTTIDLSGYYTKEEVDNLIKNYYTKEEVDNLINSLKYTVEESIETKTSNLTEDIGKTYLEANLLDES